MPRAMHYDATRRALLYPMTTPTLLRPGATYNEAQLTAECARLVYTIFEGDATARAQFQSLLTGLGFSDIQFHYNPAHDAQAMTVAYPPKNLLILAIRGTEVKWADYKTDFFEWTLRPWPAGGNVHHGFSEAIRSIWPGIERWFSTRTGVVLYTGHSMGAAMATLAAGIKPPDRVYTYGSPRAGDQAFVDSLRGVDVQRYQNCCDLVTRVPLRNMTFEHAGALNYIDRNGDIHVGVNDALIDRDCRWARLFYTLNLAWRPRNLWLRGLADHTPLNYASAILGTPP